MDADDALAGRMGARVADSQTTEADEKPELAPLATPPADRPRVQSQPCEACGTLLDPLKTTVVQGQRCMTTWVVRKGGPPHPGGGAD